MEVPSQKIIIDVVNNTAQGGWTNKGEFGVRELEIYVVKDNVVFDISTYHLTMYCITALDDKLFLTVNKTNAALGKASIMIPQQIADQAGTTKCCISFIKKDQNLLSVDFKIKVNRSIYNEESIVASDDFSALQDALAGVANLEGNYVPRLTKLETDKADKVTTTGISKRIDGVDAQLEDIQNKPFIVEKAPISYVNSEIGKTNVKINSLVSGSPKSVFSTLELLQSNVFANTTEGKKFTYLVLADGKWYYWNSTNWVVGGVYQATSIAEGSVSKTHTDFLFKLPNLIDIKSIIPNKTPTLTYNVSTYGDFTDSTINSSSNLTYLDGVGVTIYCKNITRVVYYNKSGVYIGNITPVKVSGTDYSSVNIPNDMYFVRFVFLNSSDIWNVIATFNVAEINNNAYGFKVEKSIRLDGDNVDNIKIDKEMISDSSIATNVENHLFKNIGTIENMGDSVVDKLNETEYKITNTIFYGSMYMKVKVIPNSKIVIIASIKQSNINDNKTTKIFITPYNSGTNILDNKIASITNVDSYKRVSITVNIPSDVTTIHLRCQTQNAVNPYYIKDIVLLDVTEIETNAIGKIDWESLPYFKDYLKNYSLKSLYQPIKKGSIDESMLSDIVVNKLNNDNARSLKLNVADVYYAICGEVTELFSYGMVYTLSPYVKGEYDVKITGQNIKNADEKIYLDLTNVLTPYTSDYIITLYDRYENIIETKKIIVKISSKIKTNPQTIKNIIQFGDSLTNFGEITKELIRRLNNTDGTPNGFGLSNYKLVGRVDKGNGNKYEATGGYGWNNYTDNPSSLISPFNKNWLWDSSISDINFTKYMQTYGGGQTLDYVITLLGWNHLVNEPVLNPSMTVIETKVKYFLDKLHLEYPNCKVILCGIQYTAPVLSNDWNWKTYRSFNKFGYDLSEKYKSIANSIEYKDFVTFVHMSSQFDSRFMMSTETRKVNLRSSVTEEYVVDAVHPDLLKGGYLQMADAEIRALINLI